MKIGVGFGLMGILLFGVVALYHGNLMHTMKTFKEDVLDRAEVEKSNALNLTIVMLEIRRAEKSFMLHKDAKEIDNVKKWIGNMIQLADEMLKASLANQDASSARLDEQIKEKAGEYLKAFLDMAQSIG
ncbi:MAG: hypothetical protein HQL66_15725 [Magnetococcales bacterium]|nr:hypothetical protein [Magnetococcales bacterium]